MGEGEGAGGRGGPEGCLAASVHGNTCLFQGFAFDVDFSGQSSSPVFLGIWAKNVN